MIKYHGSVQLKASICTHDALLGGGGGGGGLGLHMVCGGGWGRVVGEGVCRHAGIMSLNSV